MRDRRPSKELLTDTFFYRDGNLYWKVKRSNRCRDIAGGKGGCGYLRLRFDNYDDYIHRAIWIFHNGAIPEGIEIDHIDNNKMNNRIENLRLATRSQNAQNFKVARSDNKLGLIGVSKDSRGDYYSAVIWVNNKKIYIGNFSTAQQAHEAYLKKKREIHEHGTI